MTDSTAHETRVDVALALGGWVVFCSCGKLTGFADDAAGADKIAADHVAAATAPKTVFDLPIAAWAMRGDEDDHERSAW